MKEHPAAKLFPMMDAATFHGLKEDIKAYGLRDPIVTWQGQLLDGRNRLKACKELGVEPTFRELPAEEDPLTFVISHNLHRRHLDTSQRSMIAGRLARLKRGSNQHTKEEAPNGASSIDEAAKLLNVSPRNVDRAKKVLDAGSDALTAACDAGGVKVSLAAKLVDECDDKCELSRLAKQGPAAIKEYVTSRDYPEQEDEPEDEPDEEYDPYWDGKPDTPEVDAIKKLFAAVVQWSEENHSRQVSTSAINIADRVVYDARHKRLLDDPAIAEAIANLCEVFGGRSDG